ncbi:SPOR domain-containing protein, partial [Roseovarius amoyensis]|uniref:SPOR domain-containing protein n=1 Tax=Roseovarius amoyensis TaxID=2211448 RepID=UPI001955052F
PVPVRARTAAAMATPPTPAPPAPARPDAPPRVRTVTLSVPAAKAAPRRVAEVACTGASPLSQQYVGTGRGVRCGPQTVPHVTEIATAGPGATIYDPSRLRPAAPYLSAAYPATPVRVAPKHVYADQKASTAGIYVPPGYVPVWEDDRLNPRRAHQTLTGKAQMDSTWTRTVPRQLIPADPGPVVARGNSRLYHAAPPAPTPAAGVVVSTRGAAPATQVQAQPEPAAAATPASHRYVQLGAFTDPDHAQRTAQQIANSGLPARMGGVTRNGKSYTLVLAGPFETQKGLESGLQRVRGMGFDRAVLRR